ncbi:hypothetical protein TNIN_212871 [Trichonephila inaurata madagascariensis]|uniref:Uncharacterized protein n=1 Tax=Trichonephila inaurata madagascariensis TaxID=2747483 RepID=A0A8X6WUE0_9ARAC|nr:hypothetical protein TNIN_212871 [Trichonephila inaurata madagascariensis]
MFEDRSTIRCTLLEPVNDLLHAFKWHMNDSIGWEDSGNWFQHVDFYGYSNEWVLCIDKSESSSHNYISLQMLQNRMPDVTFCMWSKSYMFKYFNVRKIK